MYDDVAARFQTHLYNKSLQIGPSVNENEPIGNDLGLMACKCYENLAKDDTTLPDGMQLPLYSTVIKLLMVCL